MDRIEFDMSQNKKQLRMKKEDKSEMELIRRWHVKIYNIYVTPLKDKIDPFIQFTIGGDFSIAVFQRKGGESYKIAKGERGFSEKTEVIESIEPLNRAPFDKVIDIEMRMSYAMICAQKLMIEVWDHNSFFMNYILGYHTINLIDIVDGDKNQSYEITRKESKKRAVQVATVDFKCIFQEIWDFKLNFINWKAGPIVELKKGKKDDDPKILHSQLMIEMDDKRIINGHNKAYSDISEDPTSPIWSEFTGAILFRGTCYDLENAEVILTLYDVTSIISRKINTKTVVLSGIFDFERIKSNFTLTNDNNDKFTSKVEGFVMIDQKIKYKQTGLVVSLYSKKKYLCVSVMRADGIRPLESRGIVNSYISVEWSGQAQKTRTVIENNNPVFNETLYFEIPFPTEWLEDPTKYMQKLNEEFVTKNEVIFNLMTEGDDNTYDNLGTGTFHLSDIKTAGEKTQRKYYAEDLKKDKIYSTRLFVGKCKLISAFSQSNSTNLNFEAWFLDDFPDIIDFGEKKKESEKEDVVPTDLLPYFQKSKTYFLDRFFDELKGRMAQATFQAKDRCDTEKFFRVEDQYKKYHFLPYYLGIITPPEEVFSKEDQEKNKCFHDYNLKTLDEVAHYVHCFPYNSEKADDIWVSPDYMLKTRKGDIESHAILCACLMMGLGEYHPKRIEDKINTKGNIITSLNNSITPTAGNNSTPSTATPSVLETTQTSIGTKTSTAKGNTPTANGNTTDGKVNNDKKEKSDKAYHPYENRVFVCVGKLKVYKSVHIWIMTIDDEYKGVYFWDPQAGLKYELPGRVDDPDKLKNFLDGKFADYESLRNNRVTKNKVKMDEIKEEEEEKNSLMEESTNSQKNYYNDRKIPGFNDSYEGAIAYRKGNNEDTLDNILDDNNYRIHTNFKLAGAKNAASNRIDIATFSQNFDERVVYKKELKENEDIKKNFNFLDDQRDKIKNKLAENKNTFSKVEYFKDKYGRDVNNEDLRLPYETLDFIFNRNNIWINLNNHDPKYMKYNIYDPERWMPFFDIRDRNNQDSSSIEGPIWTGNFDMFYSLTNFGPSFRPKTVNKMRENLIKEVTRGIIAARSGLNLQTRFKKKNEHINDILGRFCTFNEERALNRISKKEYDQKKEEWEIMIKQKLPKYFRMEWVNLFFNSYELESIRRQITDDLLYFYKTKQKNLMFATSAGVFPYLNQVVSVRIIIAKFYKVSEEEVNAEDLRDFKDSATNSYNIQEEQDSDNENEEEPAQKEKKIEMTKLENTPSPSPNPEELKEQETVGSETNLLVKGNDKTKTKSDRI